MSNATPSSTASPAPTLDTVGSVKGLGAVRTAVRTGSCFPDSIETSLDDAVERLGPKFYYTQFRKFRYLLDEGRTVFMYIRFCRARGTNVPGSVSLLKSGQRSPLTTGVDREDVRAGAW
jgi:hypothetical protein